MFDINLVCYPDDLLILTEENFVYFENNSALQPQTKLIQKNTEKSKIMKVS